MAYPFWFAHPIWLYCSVFGCALLVSGCDDGSTNDSALLFSVDQMVALGGDFGSVMDDAVVPASDTAFGIDTSALDRGLSPDGSADANAAPNVDPTSSENGASTFHDGACLGEIFVSPSISDSYRDRVVLAYETVCQALGDVRPLEIWVTANIESEASALRDAWCDRRMALDPNFQAFWCTRSQLGVNLANYVHWSSVYYPGLTRAHHQLNLSMFSDNPNDLSAEYVTMHEFFHAYQFAHLDQGIYNTFESRDVNLGRTAAADRPWHTEGSANYVSWLLTERHFQAGFLRHEMRNILSRCEAGVTADFQVTALTYDDPCAYDLGTWAIAYLVSLHSLASYLDFYDDLNDQGFYAAFEARFGTTVEAFSPAFTAWFLNTSSAEKLSLFD